MRSPGPGAIIASRRSKGAITCTSGGRIVLDVAAADLEAAEAVLGPFHETTWHFRNALAEARRSWDRLRAEFGTSALEAALAEPPLTLLALGGGESRLPAAI